MLESSVYKGTKFAVSVDGVHPLRRRWSTFISGLACLLACYVTFNIAYDEGAEATLEFIQRYVN